MNQFLYDKRYNCLACNEEFTTKKVRSNKARVVRQDSDLCAYFEPINPYYYEINVCPYCGWAFSDSFTPFSPAQKQTVYDTYSRYILKGPPQLCDVRGEQEAIYAFKLALGAGYIKREQLKYLAGICMRIAWLHRQGNRPDKEKEFLVAACRFFTVAYETQLDDDDTAYFLHMLAETNLRLGRIPQARRWFSQLFSPRYADYRFIETAREAWLAHRQQQEGQEVE